MEQSLPSVLFFVITSSKLDSLRSVLTALTKVFEKREPSESAWDVSSLARSTALRKSTPSPGICCVAGIIHTEQRNNKINPVVLIFFNIG